MLFCHSAHNVLFVMEQGVAQTAHVFPLKFDVKRIHHELAFILVNTADNPFFSAGLVATTFTVLGTFDHGHLTVGCDRLWPFGSIRRLSDVWVRDRHHGRAHLRETHVGENGTHTTTALVSYSACICKCGLCHNSTFSIKRPDQLPRQAEAYVLNFQRVLAAAYFRFLHHGSMEPIGF